MADFPSRSPNLDDYGKEFGKYLGMRSELNEIGYVEFIAELDWFWFHSEENSKSSIEIPKGILHLWDCISHDKEVRELAIDPDMEEKVTIGCDGESTYLIGGDDV